MPGYHLYKRKNGSGKISDFWHVNFTVGGGAFRLGTGERDRDAADFRAATLCLEAHQRARLAVLAGDLQLGDKELAHVAGLFLDEVERRLKDGELTRSERYYVDLDRDLRCHILQKFNRCDEVTSAAWDAAAKAWHAEGLSWRTIQMLTTTVRHVLRYASTLGLLPIVPELRAPSRELVQAEQGERRALTEKARDRFLAEVKKISARAWRIYVILF